MSGEEYIRCIQVYPADRTVRQNAKLEILNSFADSALKKNTKKNCKIIDFLGVGIRKENT